MSRIGILSLYLPGHLHPSLALAAHLVERGHEVVFLNTLDAAAACERVGVRLVWFGAAEFPLGSLAGTQAGMGLLHGPASFTYFLERMVSLAQAAFAELPARLRTEGLDLLVVDQLFPGGSTLAEHVGVPFVSLAAALMFNREDGVPPPTLTWPYDPSPEALARNRRGWAAVSKAFAPLLGLVNAQRAQWGLAPYSDFLEDSFSPLLQIAQHPPALEFPRVALPPSVRMVGPLRRPGVFPPSAVPEEWLDGRPLIYASLGTLQNGLEWIFRAIFEAVAPLEVQAVVSLGGGWLAQSGSQPGTLGQPPRNVLLMPYAPQLELLARATLSITHAGLNTTTDCLAAGVPMVAIPIASEQPGIAARIAWTGTGVMIPLHELTPERLCAAVTEVLSHPGYRERAQEHARLVGQLRPLEQAAEEIEAVLHPRL